VVERGAQRGEVVGRERVAAFERTAVAEAETGAASHVAMLPTERLVALEVAGGAGAGMHRRVLALRTPGEASRIGEDSAGEAGLVIEFG
jgi:hypothetical protein